MQRTKRNELLAEADAGEDKISPGVWRDDLPTYTDSDIQVHNSAATRIWVSFGQGVYDITEFIESHPGGNKILMSAGASIEPFWEIYPVHNNPEVFAILERHRIGNLKPTENPRKDQHQTVDPFQSDPKRHALLKVLSAKPFNAETPPAFSVENPITPNELHFKRNHLPVPQVDLEQFQLTLTDSITNETKTLSLDDIKTKFPIHTIPGR